MNYFIGVDVGTGSVRVAIFDALGRKYISAKKEITTWMYEEVYKEQSSDEIWDKISELIKKVVKESKIDKKNIKGIGFDATCSLVALDSEGKSTTISKSGDSNRNIILWMDHRAQKETEVINSKKYSVLEYVGGKISIEMEIPKILWLKNNMLENYKKIRYLFDLPDFLVYKATGKIVHSCCSLGCKWNYLTHEKKWDRYFLKDIGLEDMLIEKSFGEIKEIGTKAGTLSQEIAEQLELQEDTVVGVSMIDAHAGGLGIIGIDDKEEIRYEERIAVISGTSTCHMLNSSKKIKVSGVWGPYYDVMVSKMWLLEGGQSTTGALIDYIITSHPAYTELKNKSIEEKMSIYKKLNEILEKLAIEKRVALERLTENIHILPYFIGNRSPRADFTLKGMISGLTMDTSLENLAIFYLATMQAIVLGTNHILETVNKKGFDIKKIFITGGGTKNELLLKLHANITGCQVILGKEEESVLLGSAMLGAVAANEYETIQMAMLNMSHLGEKIEPEIDLKFYYMKKYKVFKKMYDDYCSYKEIMLD